MLPDFKIYNKAMVVTTASYQHKNKVFSSKEHSSKEQNTESPEIKSHSYGQLIYNKGAKYIPQEDNLFNKWCW